jgi:beta-N-acetylhexosaminidase
MITYPAKAVEMIAYLEWLGKKYPEYRLRIEQAAARIIRLKYLSGIWKEN